MDSTESTGWLGYAVDRSRGRVGLRAMGDRVLLLGKGAKDLSTLVAFAAVEAGKKPVVLDIDGSVSQGIHGYFDAFDYRTMLYEAFHLEGDDARHGQLVSSAYSAALDLTSEEEAILSSALQRLSAQDDMATPSSLFDVLGSVEGFRGFYVDKLKGRIGSLKLLETTRTEGFDAIMKGGALVTFATAPYPQAADLAAGLYLAKILYLLDTSRARPDAVIITGAHRLFRSPAHPQHGGRLLAHMLEAQIHLILASPLPALLDARLVESMGVRVYSSEAWNARRNRAQAAALACSYTVCDDRSGSSFGFVPRFVRPRGSPRRPSQEPTRTSNPDLTKTILEEVGKFEAGNRQSIISFLTPLFLSADVGAELDRLHSEGYLTVEPKDVGGGPKILAYTVTDGGKRLLERLRG